MHLLDQENAQKIPKRYYSNGMLEGVCDENFGYTNGEILFSRSQMISQISCGPDVGNAGNYYSFPAAIVEGRILVGNESNSICPKGWMLTTNTTEDTKSFYYLLIYTYSVEKDPKSMSLQPLSFIYAGRYSELQYIGKESSGEYWSSKADGDNRSYRLSFSKTSINTQFAGNGSRANGQSIRCVSR